MVMNRCQRCDAKIEAGEEYKYAGEDLCEDCYIDIKSMPKTCDPWAVHSARKMKDTASLTPIQQSIFDVIKASGPLLGTDICELLKIDEDEFKRNFTPLRHMELVKAYKMGDKVFFSLFND